SSTTTTNCIASSASPASRWGRCKAEPVTTTSTTTRPASRPASGGVGEMLREWREDRRRSQLELALDVGVSTRHLSFVETGKAKPSPELVLAIAEHLDVPLRERNSMLLAAGYAPRYP